MSLLFFRWFLWAGRREIARVAGRDVRAEALDQARRLLVRVPHLGRSGAHAFLVATCFMVALHRALPGRTAAENGALFADLVRARLLGTPRALRSAYRWLYFQPWYGRALYASVVGDSGMSGAGFVGRFVPGDSPASFGVDYSECALQKFLRAVDCPELGPHVCQLDFVESEVFGLGLVRTGTLGQGARGCDFRWRRPTSG